MDSFKVLAFLFGLGFLAIGYAGYSPTYLTEEGLFGYFEVDSMHNIFHIVCGAFALFAAFNSGLAKLYFEVIGIVFLAVAALGFIFDGNLYIMHANMADNIFNLSVAVVALYMGFLHKSQYE